MGMHPMDMQHMQNPNFQGKQKRRDMKASAREKDPNQMLFSDQGMNMPPKYMDNQQLPQNQPKINVRYFSG